MFFIKRFIRKNKKALTIVGVILATALLVGMLAATTSVIGKISNTNILGLRDQNKDNLFEFYSDSVLLLQN